MLAMTGEQLVSGLEGHLVFVEFTGASEDAGLLYCLHPSLCAPSAEASQRSQRCEEMPWPPMCSHLEQSSPVQSGNV